MSDPARTLLKHPPPRETDTTTAAEVNVRSVALTVVAFGAGMGLLYWAREVFIPIILSVLISYALEPIVRMLMRVRLPRVLASAVVMVLLTGLVGYGGYALSDDASAIVAELPDAATRLRMALRRDSAGGGAIEQVKRAAEEIQKTADEAAGPSPAPRGVTRVQIEEPTIDVREYLSWGSTSLIAFVAQATLIVFFVFFLLASGDLFKRKLVKLAGPSLEKKRITVQILDDINTQISRFLLVRVVTSIGVGVATWLAFEAVGVRQAGAWAVAAGVFNSIPYFGPMLVAAGTFVVAFLQFDTIGMGVYVAAISLAITSIEGWALTPWLTSRTARTNEVAVFVGLIFWSFVWGLWGTLLAVPMLVAVKACCDRVDDLKPLAELLGE